MARKFTDTICPPDLAQDLKYWCRRWRVSQSALAMRVGVSASYLNQIINGRAQPGPDLIRKLLDVLEHEDARRRAKLHHERGLEAAQRPSA